MSKAHDLLAEIEAIEPDADGWRRLPALNDRREQSSRTAVLGILNQQGVIDRLMVRLGRAGTCSMVRIISAASLADAIWPATIVAELAELWASGLSASEIARKLDATKNAVIGKVHRMGLEARPSPIPPRKPKPVPYVGRVCQWPDGHPGEPGFHFCGAPVAAGRPYCPEHCDRAYTKRPAKAPPAAAAEYQPKGDGMRALA